MSELLSSDQSNKPRKAKSREISSRFLSPSSVSTAAENRVQSPNHSLSSPQRQKPRSSVDGRKQEVGLTRGLWPSSTPNNKKVDTLADHLGNDRLKDLVVDDRKITNSEYPMSLSRQRSSAERRISKENKKPLFGGSMRYNGNLRFPGRSEKSPSNTSEESFPASEEILPGRFSVDENLLRRRSIAQSSETGSDSEYSEIYSGANSMGSPITGENFSGSFRKSGKIVSSKYMQDFSSRSRRSSDSSLQTPVPIPKSPKMLSIKNAMKRANSLSGSGKSKWALSPGRSPPPTMDRMGAPTFSHLKPPTSPKKGILSKGLDMLRGKKSTISSPLSPAIGENVHQLRLLTSVWMQWRFINARADIVNKSMIRQAEEKLVKAANTLAMKQLSVQRLKIQVQKEKLANKLDFILHSQIKKLEAWGDLERQHLSAMSKTKDSLHTVICRVPLIEGAKMDQHSTAEVLRQASHLGKTIETVLSSLSPEVENTAPTLSELAKVVSQERALFEEFQELFKKVSELEIQERSLRSSVIQMHLDQQSHLERELTEVDRREGRS